MIKIKMFPVNPSQACSLEHENMEFGPMEEFIAQIDYNNIKRIITVSSSGSRCYYTVFYEDNLSYTPRLTPQKKGFFG